jgi:hypothetical protein
MHGDPKRRAEAELQAQRTVEQMRQLSGKYSEIELVKSDCSKAEPNHGAGSSVRLDSEGWDETIQKLAAVFNKGTSQLDKWEGRSAVPSFPTDARSGRALSDSARGKT